jgi:molybdopterin synthase catalytic subunit
MADILVDLRDQPLSVDECLAAATRPGAGGIALFVGTVRIEDGGREVTELEYSAHPRALETLTGVAGEVAKDFPVRALAVVHRTGLLAVGEIAVIAAVGCPHRAEAFAACRRLIDDLKAQVPIWKRQLFADGAQEWVGSP